MDFCLLLKEFYRDFPGLRTGAFFTVFFFVLFLVVDAIIFHLLYNNYLSIIVIIDNKILQGLK